VELGAVDGIVGGDVEIVEVGRDGEAFGNVGEIAVLGRSDDLDLAVTPGLLDGFLGPDARIDIAGLLAEEVGGDLVERVLAPPPR